MNENKKEFVTAIGEALKMDDRSGIKSIEYATNIWFEDVLYEEVVQINYHGGRYALINITANSNGANATAIINEVYGSGAIGHIFYGFEEEIK